MMKPAELNEKRTGSPRRLEDSMYRGFFQTLPYPSLIADDHFIIVDANRAYCELLKGTRARIVGHSSAEFMDSKVSLAAYGEFKQFKDQGSWVGRWSVKSLDGQVHLLEWTAIANFLPGLHLSIGRKLQP